MSHDTLTVADDFDGQRLDRWLHKMRPGVPNALIQKLIRKGAVRVNGKRAKADVRLTAGQVVRLPILEMDASPKSKPGERTAPFDLPVLYQDQTILVLNKPAGLAVQGGSGLTVHLEMMMDDFAVRGVLPRLVHRLDRDTSGVLVLARTASAARDLGAQFQGRAIEKKYLALVSPPPLYAAGTIDAPLAKVKMGRDLEKVQVSRHGDPATTTYTTISEGTITTEGMVSVALVEFCPETGRTHQIRVHAAHVGSPLLGDAKYGGNAELLKKIRVKSRVMLHAAQLTLTHPKTGVRMTFAAPLPPDFEKAMAKLRITMP